MKLAPFQLGDGIAQICLRPLHCLLALLGLRESCLIRMEALELIGDHQLIQPLALNLKILQLFESLKALEL